MTTTQKREIELKNLIERVIHLNNHLYGVGNWNKRLLPKTIGQCNTFIEYCKENYGVIG